MEGTLQLGKVNEITINTRKFMSKCKKNKKASGTIRMLRKFVQKQWKTSLPVYLSEDLNKKIFSRGNFSCIGRIRVRVQRGKSQMNAEESCIKVSLVDVSSFKNLKDAVVTEDE